jgi:ribosomal protein L17
VKLKNEDIVVEKLGEKKHMEKLFKEYYQKYGKRDLGICREWEVIDKETDAMLDDY